MVVFLIVQIEFKLFCCVLVVRFVWFSCCSCLIAYCCGFDFMFVILLVLGLVVYAL